MASVNRRAILTDIHDLNLDPKIAHEINGKTRRLQSETVVKQEALVLEPIVEHVPVQVKVLDKEPDVIETIVDEERVEPTIVPQDEPKVDEMVTEEVSISEDEKLDDSDEKADESEVDHEELEEQKLDD